MANINTLRPKQNGRHFADDTFKRIFLKENVRISIKISLKFVPKSRINNIRALFQIMAWRRPGDKPLSDAMMVSLLTHICVARPQWVKRAINDWTHNATAVRLEKQTFMRCGRHIWKNIDRVNAKTYHIDVSFYQLWYREDNWLCKFMNNMPFTYIAGYFFLFSEKYIDVNCQIYYAVFLVWFVYATKKWPLWKYTYDNVYMIYIYII